MATVELVLLLAAVVLISSVIDQVVPRVSLPLIQIVLGVFIALLAVSPVEFSFSPEIFLVVFIAPLLFHEARESDKLGLWKRRREIVWLAVGLVVVICLVVGYSLHWLVPSVPLAAAFALGAALGPTDAVAVSSLSTVAELDRRESALLSGESLLNDATGVVSFQFAIAAAVTGAFSLADATVSFVISFVGGILLGIILAFLVHAAQEKVREMGLASITFHVLLEVFLPFMIYLLAEMCHVSGILAVVAAGLTLSSMTERAIGPNASRLSIVSSNVWNVLSFTLNGIVFVLLGMQLPRAMQSTWDDVAIDNTILLGYILAVALVIMVVRFIWIIIGEHAFKDPGCSKRRPLTRASVRSALISTVGGPKGAVTLSVIFSIPLLLDDGSSFSQRNLLIFLASGVILCTLIVANFALPLLAPKHDQSDEEEEGKIERIKVEIFRHVIEELAAMEDEDSSRATHAVIHGYNERIKRVRTDAEDGSPLLSMLRIQVIADQEEYLVGMIDSGQVDEFEGYAVIRRLERARNLILHRSEGRRVATWFFTHFGTMRRVLRKAMLYAFKRLHGNAPLSTRSEIQRLVDLHAVEYLQGLNSSQDAVSIYPPETVTALVIAYQAAARSLQATRPDITMYTRTTDNMDEIERYAYHLELDEIQRRLDEGDISRAVAKDLRDNVYLMLVDLDAHM